MIFKEAIEGWRLCGKSLTQAIYERAAVLTKTSADRAKLLEVLGHYQEEALFELKKLERLGEDVTEAKKLVLQVSDFGLYEGPLLYDRFQVMGSVSPIGTYYLVDHTLPDLLHRESGLGSNVARFPSIDEARDAALKLCIYKGDEIGYTKEPQSRGPSKEKVKTTMAKKAPDLKVVPAAPAAAAEPATRTRSAASAFREHIMAGKLTDDEIFAAVQKEFGLDDSKRSYVAWYRNDLTKKGQNPPAAKGGAAPRAAATPTPKAAVAPVAKAAVATPTVGAKIGRKAVAAPAPAPVAAPARGRPKKGANAAA